ncbi:abc-2 type transporter [Anaeramoeba ignava]|uniref:Abc-2 type transporter n=1 Tax=Anaeramoeba ignava TaxID=1746090 RepID=A0A9Q0LTY6_ANAIG|nr:abc-2 type transporter [Anaeramoeba ignava]
MSEITKIPIFVRDFSFNVKTKKGYKTILDHINLSIPSGSLVAIIGASGAGKTTLLNSIAGRVSGKSEGSILFGNEPHSDRINKILSYVTQQDTMHTNLTPRQILRFVADLRLPKTIKKQEKNQIVENILKSLQIEHCADTIVGSPESGIKRGISGGEMKRVNIGMGLVTNPSVILVDEPTSGLDAQTAYLCTTILKDLTKDGRTIISTIHQPRQSIFELFDYLVLLSHGKLVYFGPINEIENYFSAIDFYPPRNTNLADWIIDLVSLSEGELKKEETINKLSKSLSVYQKDEIQLDIIHDKNDDKKDEEKDEEKDDKNEVDKDKKDELEIQDIPNDFEDVDIPKIANPNFIQNNSNGIIKGEVGTLEFIKSLVKYYNDSDLMKKTLSMEIPKEKMNLHLEKTANSIKKTLILTKRGFYGLRNQKRYVIQRLLQPAVLSCLVGWVFTGISNNQSGLMDRMGILFFIILSQMMMTIIAVLFVLPKEKAVFLRESMDSAYPTFSFFLSKILTELPFGILVPTIFAVIISPIAGLQTEPKKLFTLVAFCILSSNTGSSFGYMISAATRLPEIALALAPVMLVPMIMFCGFMIDLNNITKALSWIQYIDPIKYSYLVVVKNEFTGLKFTCTQSELVQGICPVTTGEQFLKLKDYYDVSFWENALVMLAFIFGSWILSIYFLSKARKREAGR